MGVERDARAASVSAERLPIRDYARTLLRRSLLGPRRLPDPLMYVLGRGWHPRNLRRRDEVDGPGARTEQRARVGVGDPGVHALHARVGLAGCAGGLRSRAPAR